MLSPASKRFEPALNRVPKVTVDFWLIKLMAVTVGETAADFLAVNLGYGLTATSLFMSAILFVALVLQFRQKCYVPWAYWLAVVLISVVGTLITDNLVDSFGVRLETTTIAFSIALAATFAVWYASERTLSIHTIFTTQRETFYWLAILFTFSLGTAAGDLIAETFALGVLARLHPDTPARRVLRRPSFAAGRIWRVRLRHHRHQLPIPRRHRPDRSLHDPHQEQPWRRRRGACPSRGAIGRRPAREETQIDERQAFPIVVDIIHETTSGRPCAFLPSRTIERSRITLPGA
jgi:hypothetical protein